MPCLVKKNSRIVGCFFPRSIGDSAGARRRISRPSGETAIVERATRRRSVFLRERYLRFFFCFLLSVRLFFVGGDDYDSKSRLTRAPDSNYRLTRAHRLEQTLFAAASRHGDCAAKSVLITRVALFVDRSRRFPNNRPRVAHKHITHRPALIVY